MFEHAKQEAPGECCGLVIEDKKIQKYVPMKNIATNKNTFLMNAEDFVRYQLNSKIKYVVHSHYDSDVRPSKHDIDNCKAVGIPYMIVSYPQKEVNIIQP